jgi:hypothetical protein
MSCEYCENKCSTCLHKDEEFDISDSWEDEDPIYVSFCDNIYEHCDDYKQDGNYCKMCGEKLTK